MAAHPQLLKYAGFCQSFTSSLLQFHQNIETNDPTCTSQKLDNSFYLQIIVIFLLCKAVHRSSVNFLNRRSLDGSSSSYVTLWKQSRGLVTLPAAERTYGALMMITQMAKSTASVAHTEMFAERLHNYLHWIDWIPDCCFSAIKALNGISFSPNGEIGKIYQHKYFAALQMWTVYKFY